MSKRASTPFGPALEIDRGGAEALHRQIYFAIRQAILSGALRPGARLPATRAVARDLGVSRNTVMAAFEQLHAEGYIDGRVGAGSFVSHQLPEVLGARGRAAPARAAPARPPRPVGARRAADRASAAAAAGRSRSRPACPSSSSSRSTTGRGCWRGAGGGRAGRSWSAASPAGYRPLCQAIADYLASARAVSCSPEQVIVVSGTQQALDLAARVLIDPGDAVWIEEPGYPPPGRCCSPPARGWCRCRSTTRA